MHKGLLGQSEGGASVDQTLGDYITRKYRQIALEEVAQERKLTFDEWWNIFKRNYSSDDYDSLGVDFHRCWKAAQENK
jgi:hypothetical protein